MSLATRGLGPAKLLPTGGLGPESALPAAFYVSPTPSTAVGATTADFFGGVIAPAVMAAATAASVRIALFVTPSDMEAAATAAAAFYAEALQVTPLPMEAGTLVVVEFDSGVIIYLKDLWRANEPQDVVDVIRPKRTRRLPLPQTLEEVPDRLPDRLPTLDCW